MSWRRALILLWIGFSSLFFVVAMYGVSEALAWLFSKSIDTSAYLVWAAIVFPLMCWVGFRQAKDFW